MPSTHRTQVLLPDHVQARVQQLATQSKRSMSAMCSELIEYALTHGEQYQVVENDTNSSIVEALVNGAILDDERMRKLHKLLDALE